MFNKIPKGINYYSENSNFEGKVKHKIHTYTIQNTYVNREFSSPKTIYGRFTYSRYIKNNRLIHIKNN